MRWKLVLIVPALLLAGCIGGEESQELEEAQVDNASEMPDVELPELKENEVHVNVTVPVVLVGYSDEQASALEGELENEDVHHQTSDFPQIIRPDPSTATEQPSFDTFDLGVQPTADYDVRTLDNETEADLDQRLATWTAGGSVGPGHALEAYLAEQLDPDPNAPSLVLVNSDGLEHGPDAWRYQMKNGYLEPVDSFGELEPLHVIDVAHNPDAAPDDAAATEGVVHEVTHYRLLQGTVYPPSTAECHALTVVTAYRPTALANYDPGMQNPEELFDPAMIEGAYENLTSNINETVHVDAKVLELPVDDPVLDALSRGEFATFEAQRAWITQNWDEYWVEHEGCEAYVSFVVHTDAASTMTAVNGIGLYDESTGYRVGLSWINELQRYLTDNDSPLSSASPLGQGESVEEYNYLNYLHAHEAGHTFSMRHPHDISGSGGGGSSTAHEDVWSTMSYSNDGRAADFGAIDQANFARNKVGALVLEAQEQGASEEDLTPALEHIAAYEWAQAAEDLRELIDAGASEDDSEGERERGDADVELWEFSHDPFDPLAGLPLSAR